MQKNQPLQFCNETIHPGESLSLALPMPELFSCAPLYMPIKVVHGKKAGPCLLVIAAMHGDELNGTEIVNRLMELNTLKKLRGTLITVPVFNVYGLLNRSRHLPGGVDLYSAFPGNKNGTHAARIAHLFTTEIFSKADICLDLQTGELNHTNLPQVFVNFDDKRAKQLADVFSAPVISNIACEKGMLRTLAHKQQKPYITYEAGEAMRFDEHAIKVGLKGIMHIMRKLDMIPSKSPTKDPLAKSFFTDKNIWIRASTSGVSHSKLKLGQCVKKGETLCVIKDPFGATASETVTSPQEGVIVSMNNLPLVHEGESLFQLATFPKIGHAASHLEDWEQRSNESF